MRAQARAASDVDELCSMLEGLAGAVAPLTPPATSVSAGSSENSSSSASDGSTSGSGQDLLAGVWRLVYSSGFNSGSLGGRRPGPPAALVPAALGQVYQRIEPRTVSGAALVPHALHARLQARASCGRDLNASSEDFDAWGGRQVCNTKVLNVCMLALPSKMYTPFVPAAMTPTTCRAACMHARRASWTTSWSCSLRCRSRRWRCRA